MLLKFAFHLQGMFTLNVQLPLWSPHSPPWLHPGISASLASIFASSWFSHTGPSSQVKPQKPIPYLHSPLELLPSGLPKEPKSWLVLRTFHYLTSTEITILFFTALTMTVPFLENGVFLYPFVHSIPFFIENYCFYVPILFQCPSRVLPLTPSRIQCWSNVIFFSKWAFLKELPNYKYLFLFLNPKLWTVLNQLFNHYSNGLCQISVNILIAVWKSSISMIWSS